MIRSWPDEGGRKSVSPEEEYCILGTEDVKYG